VLGVRTREEPDVAWRLVAGAMAAWACGWILWVALYERDGSPPYPSLSDPLWLLFYVGVYVALVMVVQREGEGVPRDAWLDGLVGAAAASAFVAQFALSWVTTGIGGWAARLTLLAYPLADVALVGLAALVIGLHAWRPSPRWTVVGTALVPLGVADGVWSYEVAHGTYREGSATDLLYSATAVLLVAGALVSRRPQADGRPTRQTRQLPAVFTVAALGLLVWGALSGDLALAAVVLASIAVLSGTV
jgi:hypothetical protein